MPRLVDADWLHEKFGAAQKQLETDCDALWKVNKPYYKALAWARRIINEAITIEINSFRPHGRWTAEHTCTNCGEYALTVKVDDSDGEESELYYHTPCCPWCGAKMDKEAEND